MDILIWAGAAVSIAGLLGLMWCIVRVWKARKSGLDNDAMRAVLKSVVPVNAGALFLSVIGLMMVVIGIFLS
ncbi:hypothetical protein OO012_15755 [Rhodobacteraceae bacterium KMM 6894]|nr:hypothetical protein [Rhodobacteraceae bacterium KMM 6894]